MDDDVFDLSIDKKRSLTLTPEDDQPLIMPAEYPVGDKERRRIEATDDQIFPGDQKTVDYTLFNPKDQLCAGERLDDAFHSETPKEEDQVNENNDLKAEDNNSCSEKRREFSLTHSPGSSAFHSVDSTSSELSSHSRHSVTSFLQAREYDAEDVLLGLGLGVDCRMSVPERFLVNSSSAKGIDLHVIRRNIEEEEDDMFDINSLSYSSSWSERNHVLERLPSRFVTSTSSFGSTTDLSEPEENETQISTVPVIVEPEQSDENSFDLMRHLRLNRIQTPGREHQHDRILLEPVTEELEVSSVGSGSVRTRISNTQQDSLDSLGNTSVLTKTSRRHSEDSFKERIPLDNSCFQEEPCDDNQQTTEKDGSVEDDIENNEQEYDNNENLSTENSNQETQTNQGDNESGISSAGDSVNLNIPGVLKPPVLRVLASDTVHRDSFELEEIATSEENLDKIEDKKTTNKDGKTRALKRENSDESSGFEDDTQVKKRSSESLDADDTKTSSLENPNGSIVKSTSNYHQEHLIVPIEVSATKTDAEMRRSAFAKRSSWSTTKQKRVAFQDEALELRTKSRSFDEQNLSAYKLESRFSLDIPLTCTETREADSVAETPTDNKDIKKYYQPESTPEKTAVQNIRKFLSSLMSIRSKFRKTEPEEEEVVSTTDVPLSSLTSTESTSLISVLATGAAHVTEVSDSGFLRHDVKKGVPEGERDKISNAEIECFVSKGGAYQNHCLEELDSFEEDLNKYHATFMTMEMTSTSQDSYYTKKSLARFAWDIIAVRRLRSLIIKELATMQSCLTDRKLYVSEFPDTPLPHGVVEQVKCLLSMQYSLQNYLLKLAGSVPRYHWKATSSPLMKRSAVNTSERATEDITNEIKHSLFQELNQMFQAQVESLRQELKEKDDVINELLVKVERIEKASDSPKHEL